MTPGDQSRAIPFVGPRAYEIGEKLFGRDRERVELLDLLIAERIVLLYSPSGAGKTSLVQAALVPALRNEEFTVPTVARVTLERGDGITEPAANRYVFAVLLSLEEAQPEEQQLPLAELARMTLPDYLEQRWTTASETGGLVLIFDQFEEVLTIDPTDTEAKKELFAQLGVALRNPHRWALFAMREEHVAGLDSYRSLIPTRLNTTFRLELLNGQQARQTMQEALAQAGVVFTDGAARGLTDDLRRVRVQRPGGSLEERLGPTVEPTQLQVVCLRLWQGLPAGKASIEESDVETLGSVDTALADYYAAEVARLGTRERFVRDWIEDVLITQQGLRNQILEQDALRSRRVDVHAISALDRSHLLRGERRRGITWLELAHDRLVEPIRRDNAAWREAHLTPFQRQATLWDRQRRPSQLELRGAPLSVAKHWAERHHGELTPTEESFLKICMESRRWRRTRIVLSILLVTALGFEPYREWLKSQPWAYLTYLPDNQTYRLSGDNFSIGRSPAPIRNRINVEPNVVSRVHLTISRELEAQDARSLNGTIINGRFLRYATERQLRDGDLITLAGVAPYRFYTPRQSVIPFLPPNAPKPSPLLAKGAWAILIDGRSKTTIPLIDSDYFLARGERGNISLDNSETGGSLLKITRVGGKYRNVAARWFRKSHKSPNQFEIETLYTSDEYHLFAMLKYEDRHYFAIAIPSRISVGEFLKDISGAEYASKMSFCFGQPSPEAESSTISGVQTNVMEIVSDEEPSCTLGPFQIVPF
jgi:hypothetical protein